MHTATNSTHGEFNGKDYIESDKMNSLALVNQTEDEINALNEEKRKKARRNKCKAKAANLIHKLILKGKAKGSESVNGIVWGCFLECEFTKEEIEKMFFPHFKQIILWKIRPQKKGKKKSRVLYTNGAITDDIEISTDIEFLVARYVDAVNAGESNFDLANRIMQRLRQLESSEIIEQMILQFKELSA